MCAYTARFLAYNRRTWWGDSYFILEPIQYNRQAKQPYTGSPGILFLFNQYFCPITETLASL
jgi:hypothetical protein